MLDFHLVQSNLYQARHLPSFLCVPDTPIRPFSSNYGQLTLMPITVLLVFQSEAAVALLCMVELADLLTYFPKCTASLWTHLGLNPFSLRLEFGNVQKE